eukprot:6275228-Pyramimonas_sp.AAC.1
MRRIFVVPQPKAERKVGKAKAKATKKKDVTKAAKAVVKPKGSATAPGSPKAKGAARRASGKPVATGPRK